MPRYFTLAQAQRALPEVERALRDALFHRAEAVNAYKELEQHSERVRMLGGMRVNPGEVLALKSRLETSSAALKDAIEQVENTGAQIKDLDTGLIDFLARYGGRDVCLCWKLGESQIGFWHGINEGFRGRKPIDRDFVDGHSGAAPGAAN